MEAPIDTLSYLVAGYIVIFGGLILYVASLLWRTAKLRQQLIMLRDEDELKQEERSDE